MADQNKRARNKTYKKKNHADYDQNDGVAGVIYVLTNPSLKWNTLKIGCSRHSGRKRVEDINRQASTGIPASFKLQYECKTTDCGLAEKRVFEKLKDYRVVTNKVMQEFFSVDLKVAIKTIKEECKKVDIEYKKKQAKPEVPPKIAGTRVMLGRYRVLKELEK